MKTSSSKATVLATATVLGLDVSDRKSTYVALDAEGTVVAEGKVGTVAAELEALLTGAPPLRIALEAGTHSPWLSELLREGGHEVVVANARQLGLIYQGRRKNDQRDALHLAQLARVDVALLAPIQHRGREAQLALAVVRSRDVLVATRTQLINHVRGVVKTVGERLPRCAAEAFLTKAAPALPGALQPALAAVVEQIAALTSAIGQYDQQIAALVREAYPEAQRLQQVAGVGPITSLTYVLTLEDPQRFTDSRDVPAYLGLTPGQEQSGASDPDKRITKAGDALLRRLLVQAAHYVLGVYGPDTDLRRWGLGLAGGGGKRLKKRAVVAVARKLAVLLHVLWREGTVYEPLRNARKAAA
jgi:transposase